MSYPEDIPVFVKRHAVKGEDGYYLMSRIPATHVTADDLRIMADALDAMNAEWDQIVKEAT
jgi:hypothetical protein